MAAARAAFPGFARTSRKERLELLRAILAEYNKRRNDAGDAISREMGAPLQFARDIQAGRGTAHLERMIEVLETYPFESVEGGTLIVREPIGVCGLITPWNWPINQIAARSCRPSPRAAPWC